MEENERPRNIKVENTGRENEGLECVK